MESQPLLVLNGTAGVNKVPVNYVRVMFLHYDLYFVSRVIMIIQ